MLKKIVKKALTLFRPKLRTRNYSADDLRSLLFKEKFPRTAIIRLGSTTPNKEITSVPNPIEINTVESIENSRSKIRSHKAFDAAGVKSAKYWTSATFSIDKIQQYPVLAKKIAGQGGVGMKKLDNKAELQEFLKKVGSLQASDYYIEEYFSGKREYRLHVTKNDCFLAWRKMRKQDAKEKWYFNSDNCVWVGEQNPLFDKPVNWDEMIADSVKALNAVGLSIGAIDLRVQSATDENGRKRKSCQWIILESNSAPSMAPKTTEAYHKEIVKLIREKC